MDFITAYLVGFVALVGMFALRAPHENLRTVFVLAVAWPLSILAILAMVLMTFTGWNLDVAKGSKMFGFRKPTNTGVTGFAITVFYGEVQFWKTCKTVSQ